ncbi:glutamate--tRNA ligase [bacterium]|nr:glutamate--tRNA ligase [bacterium]
MRTNEENIKLANLLFPSIKKSVGEMREEYPSRGLQGGSLVVRFAPSPTGFLHMGSVFTSLINRRLVDQVGGVCILRIEDTDKKREIEGGVDIIVNGLSEFGIEFDESVQGGKYGPYIQSERLDIYKVFAKDLVSKGFAYPCFANEEELGEIRDKQTELGVRTGYYGEFAKWRDSSLEEIESALGDGKEFVIRLYSTGDNSVKFEFDDEIKGRCTFAQNDMDVVLLKSDGYPTYHFAHAIDDTLMGVNLVIRTYEWFPSVPLHLELFEKLGFERIKYAHASPLMKMEGGKRRKLSKRKDPEADTRYFIERGYPIVPILEYFLNIMNSNFADWRIQNPELAYTEFELKLEKFNRAGALFDMVKLEDVCKEYIAGLSAKDVYDMSFRWAQKFNSELVKRLEENRELCINILNIEREGSKIRKDIVKWEDVNSAFEIFFEDMLEGVDCESMPENVSSEVVGVIVDRFLESYSVGDDTSVWFEKIKGIGNDLGFTSDYKAYKDDPTKFKGKVGDIAMVLRIALTKRSRTPDLHQVMQVMGKEMVEARLRGFMI